VIDWFHVAEVVASNLFGAGIAYGVITTKIAALDNRVRRCEDDIRGNGNRIDNMIMEHRK
jgi:hypothetical protein